MPRLIKERLSKTRDYLRQRLGRFLIAGKKVDPELLEEIEATLIQADMGSEITDLIVKRIQREGLVKEGAFRVVKETLLEILQRQKGKVPLNKNQTGPTVILVLGVNGTGKTTTIAKLAYRLKAQGNRVLLAAADTFRAAAIEQLEFWGKRIGVDVIKHLHGADPSAVCFDAVKAALSRRVDYLIVDTAGRFHTKMELVDELKKINRTIGKCSPGAPQERLLVIDANTGGNGLIQAQQFNEALSLTGLVVAKLDGTAKGGILVSIQDKLGIPVKFIAIGQGLDDLEEFDPANYLEAIL